MPPTADTASEYHSAPAADSGVSGKWIIIGIFTLALVGAGGGWWFRYSATHRAAKFWGPQAATLIRDAPEVTFTYTIADTPGGLDDPHLLEQLKKPTTSGTVDVSKAHGLAHLRNALLEDANFSWEAPPQEAPAANWMLTFRDPTTNAEVAIAFAKNCDYCVLAEGSTVGRVISCEPIRKGLSEMFDEFTAVPPIVPPEYR